MAYGSARARIYYGAGDYQSIGALRGYVPGTYYAAGGFLGNLRKKVSGALNSGIGQLAMKAISGVPGIGTAASFGLNVLAGKPTNLASALIPGANTFLKGGLGGSQFTVQGGKGAAPAPKAKLALPAFGGAVESPRRRKRRASSRKRRSSSSRSRRRKGSSYRRGDWGDDGGRDKRGHYLNARGGHRHFRRKRRRRGGGRVSFTTKDGRRVSFTARGDSP